MEDKILRTMRNMAWERAKGELESLLHTYWDGKNNYELLSIKIEEFILAVEDNGLVE